MKSISVRISTFDTKVDEQGYAREYNTIHVLQTSSEDTPDERAKLMQMVRIALIGEIQ